MICIVLGHQCHSSILLQFVFVCRRVSCIVRLVLFDDYFTFQHLLTIMPITTILIWSISMTYTEGIFSLFLLCSQTCCMIIMSMKPSARIKKCMTSESGVQALWARAGPIPVWTYSKLFQIWENIQLNSHIHLIKN